jgi:hypothetical protein
MIQIHQGPGKGGMGKRIIPEEGKLWGIHLNASGTLHVFRGLPVSFLQLINRPP